MKSFLSKYCNICFIGAIVAIIICIIPVGFEKGTPEPIEMTVLQPDTLILKGLGWRNMDIDIYTFNPKKDRLPKGSFVRKGEKVKVLSATEPEKAHTSRFWIEKEDGSRGFISQESLEIDGVMIKNLDEMGLESGDSIQIRRMKRIHGFAGLADIYCKRLDKVIENVKAEYFVTNTVWSMKDHLVRQYDAYTLMGMKKFTELYLNTPLKDLDQVGKPAKSIIMVNDTLNAAMPLSVFDPETGYFFAPTLYYNNAGECIGYHKSLDHFTHHNKWLLKLLPGAEWVYNQSWLTWAMSEPMFESSWLKKYNLIESDSTISKILVAIPVIIILGLLFLIWLGSLGLVIPLILIGLVHFRHVYYPLSNTVLFFFILLLSLAWAYIVSILMFSYTYWYLYLPLAVFLLHYIISNILIPLLDDRCRKCKRIGTIDIIATELMKEWDTDWIEESELRMKVKTSVEKFKTWDEEVRTTIVKQGNIEISRRSDTTKKNVQEHRIEHGYNIYDQYMVKYHVQLFRQTHQCRKCKDFFYTSYTEETEIGRKKVGEYTTNF